MVAGNGARHPSLALAYQWFRICSEGSQRLLRERLEPGEPVG